MKNMRRTAGYPCKGIKNNTNIGQITGIQEKLDTTCKIHTNLQRLTTWSLACSHYSSSSSS
jgi:hypothetical protein